MKTRVIIFLLLMLMAFTAIYASENPADNEVYVRKNRELKALTEKFKAETGFEGSISNNPELMRLSVYNGRFQSIPSPIVSDSLSFRQSFNSILNLMIPYISAPRVQLTTGRIYLSADVYYTQYIQLINGYMLEDYGLVKIGYDPERDEFVMIDGTVRIQKDPITSIISVEKAKSIALYDYQSVTNPTPVNVNALNESQLVYSNRYTPEYSLVYIVHMNDMSYTYYIDAITGEIIHKKPCSSIPQIGQITVKGNRYALGNSGYNNLPTLPIGCYTMEDVKVSLLPFFDQTDLNGNVSCDIADLSNLLVILEASDNVNFKVTHSSDPETCISTDDCDPDGENHYKSVFSDIFNGHACYAPNIHIDALSQYLALRTITPSFSYGVNFVADYNFTDPNQFGSFFHQGNQIYLRDGRVSQSSKHELSHAFVYKTLFNNYITPYFEDLYMSTGAMDEAYANFLSVISCSVPIIPNPTGYISLADPNLTLASNDLVNEISYAKYDSGLYIAAAFWSLKSNYALLNYNFKNTLVRLLDQEALELNPDRYKPRYFYNLLMQRVADSGTSSELNDQQKAIKDAYNARGLHFYPKVESISGGQKGKNIFGLNEPVHVKVSDCPQNTRINIYVVKHDEYTYSDGATISTLSNYFPIGFTPHTTAITDPNGEWSGLIWNIPASGAEGDYDIIVDIGSPTSPDGVIHYAFSGANVMDGFDGRLQPGFSVLDDGIDIVVATQSSWVDTDVLSRKH